VGPGRDRHLGHLGEVMIVGTGIDIVDISRFERFVAEENLALFQRLFTPVEIDYCSARKKSAQHYAIRLAAKEALLKALGTGLRDGISWQDMEVINDHYGKPEMKLSGRAAQLAADKGVNGCFLSLSHDGASAVASVILES
jgi:holo-[acyl-carrier protein] synthase